jgi:hypothetical protein
MVNFIKKCLKNQAKYIFLIYIPMVMALILGIVIATYFYGIALSAIGSVIGFILIAMLIVFLLSLFC